MLVALLGATGNIGTRYQAILKYLKVEFLCIDEYTMSMYRDYALTNATHVIIATPTLLHIENCLEVADVNKSARILVEKPVTTELDLFDTISELDVTIMMQYRELVDPSSKGLTSYNYFRHGSDGLAWDCYQIIALATGPVQLAEDSPVWQCTINGKHIDIAKMDYAYVSYVKKWLDGYRSDFHELYEQHQKVAKFAEKFK